MAYRSASISHPGLVRDQNEDTLSARDEAGIWLVADGMGGHAGGEVASHLAVTEMHRLLSAGESLKTAIERTHHALLSRTQAEPELAGMGTTLVAAHARGRRMQLAWVGDSRIYRLADGQLRQLSVDHSFVQDMVLRGALTEAQARRHPQGNLVRQALGQAGPQGLQIDTLKISLKPGQQLLLCTDGVHDMLDSSEIAHALAQPAPEERIAALRAAVLATPASDNFSAIVIERPRTRLWRRIPHLFRHSE